MNELEHIKSGVFNPTLTKAQELNQTIEGMGDLSGYWQEAHSRLTRGYTLAVPLQNILDDIIGTVSERFRNGEIDIRKMDAPWLDAIADSIDLTPMGQFLIRDGVYHYYHCKAGIETPFHLQIDLKLLPTIHNSLGEPVAGLTYMAIILEWEGHKLTHLRPGYVGPEEFRHNHGIILRCQENEIISNHELGAWLYFTRHLDADQHRVLIDWNKRMQ